MAKKLTLKERLSRVEAEQGEAQLAAAEERRAVGRYTLDEATDVLNRGAGEQRASLLTKLIRAVDNGELPTYQPGCHARMMYEGPEDVCSFYEEVYWDDLNEWLMKNEPRVLYRIPRPKNQTADRSELPQPMSRQRAQEEAILTTLRDLEIDPHRLPVPSKAGKPSPAKQAVRSKLPYTTNVFNKAWQRLRHDGRIKDATD